MTEPKTRSVVTIGTFDGIHVGHRALLQKTRELAEANRFQSVVLTFPRPPQNYLGNPKRLLMPPEKRIALLTQHVDQVLVIEFPEIQSLSPREFVKEILCERLKAAAVVVGRNFCFGRDRQGNVSTLMELGSGLGIDVQIVDPILVNGERVSSTTIRQALQVGDIERASRLLGDPPKLWGKVIPGEGQGRVLGFPTANLSMNSELLVPGEGIYATRVFYRNQSKMASLYIGRRPTFDGAHTSIEVHILESDSHEELDLYGEELSVQLFTRLRGDRRFSSREELQAQIRADVEATQEFFSSRIRE